MEIGTRQSSILSCHDNRLPTTHQLHAATPPLLDLLAALHWTQSGISCSSKALTCTDCTSAQGQSAMLCFAACGKLSTQANQAKHTCTDCKLCFGKRKSARLCWWIRVLSTFLQIQSYASIAPSTYSASFVGWHHGIGCQPPAEN